MKLFFRLAIAVSLLVPAAFAQQAPPATQAPALERPRVFVTDSQSWEARSAAGGDRNGWGGASAGGGRPQTAEIIKTFGERCPGVLVNNLEEKADFIVQLDHEGGKGPLTHKNKVVVFERTSGDTIVSKSTLTLGGSVEDACAAIGNYWNENGARLLSAKAARETPPPPPPAQAAPATAAPATTELTLASTPDGADIEVDGAFVGSTPSTVALASGDHAVRVSKKGFQPYEKNLHTSGGKINLRAELEVAGK